MARYVLIGAVISLLARLQAAFASPILFGIADPAFKLPPVVEHAATFGAGPPELNEIERVGFDSGCYVRRL
ncbi:hypothetical protein BDW22DRAFT_1431152 [Trametopsis cervina]|nr:hypothetical protein BDW22DRAFT_1431152 [Trametopsis cervina]